MSATPPPVTAPYAQRHPRLATILSARSAYVAIVLLATLSSLEPNWHDGLAGQRLARAIHPPVDWSDTVDAIRNLLLFAGFGAIWEVTTRLRLRTALWRSTFYGFLLSATVETLQLFSPVRFASILDIITNTSGAFFGALGVAVLVASVRVRRSRATYLGVPAFLLAFGLVGAVVIERAAPLFRQVYAPGAAGGPLRRLRLTLATAAPLSTPLPRSDFGLSIPAGFLAVVALVELGLSRWLATALVVIGATAISFAAEVAHGTTGELIIWSGPVSQSLGFLVGACAAVAVIPRILRLAEDTRARLFVVAYGAVMIAWLWRPFFPRTSSAAIMEQLSSSHWIPMAAFGGSGSVLDVAQIIQLGFLFVPFGAMLEAWPARDRGSLRWLMPGVWLAAVIVIGQVFIAGRMFDITNFLIMIAGVWMGWWIARRAGIPRQGNLLAG